MTDLARVTTRTTILPRALAATAVALAAAGVALLLAVAPLTGPAMRTVDHAFYDAFFRQRPSQPQHEGPVVIVGVDAGSLEEFDREVGFGWPWPRDGWPWLVKYLQDAGAAAVVFDVLFMERSAQGSHDDEAFAEGMNGLTVPLVFARIARTDGQWGPFKPQLSRPVAFGAVDVSVDGYRRYAPQVNGRPALAVAALQAAGIEPRLPLDRPFAVRYYGPHRDADGRATIPTYMASRVMLAGTQGDDPKWGVRPEMFRGKIVLVGLLAEGLNDLKLTPMGPGYPGVEFHATAVTNLISGQQVHHAGWGFVLLITLSAGALASVIAVALRTAGLKIAAGLLTAPAVLALAWAMFRGEPIRFLPPAAPLLATVLATTGGVAWSYFGEQRRARFLLKALEQCISPAVAAELERDPGRLTVGGRQLEMTVMFTDLAGFTSLTEELKERIEPALNFYLGEMTDQILARDGTVDKYIGDAIMTFWNAPIDQPHHAGAACAAALAIQRRERLLKSQLEALGMRNTLTRIGINSGPMFVGFTGSKKKLNYTVIGDSVNLAARLEPANKLYGTQILVSEHTVARCRDEFLFRRVDLLQVKGKSEPIGVYELMGEAALRDAEPGRLVARFEQAFDLYRARRWDDAERILLELAHRFADDGPTAALLRRIAEYRAAPPPDDWNGAYVARSK